jgi:uncharacterized protein
MTRILIDGYNLLPATDYSTRDRLIAALSVYRKTKGHDVMIVFDGTYGGFGDADRSFVGGVEVLFSPLTMTADDLIEQILPRLESNSTVVVSSDRRIQDAARRFGMTFVTSQQFAQRLLLSKVGDNELDRDLDLRPNPREKRGNPRRLPKEVRRRKNALKKL